MSQEIIVAYQMILKSKRWVLIMGTFHMYNNVSASYLIIINIDKFKKQTRKCVKTTVTYSHIQSPESQALQMLCSIFIVS